MNFKLFILAVAVVGCGKPHDNRTPVLSKSDAAFLSCVDSYSDRYGAELTLDICREEYQHQTQGKTK